RHERETDVSTEHAPPAPDAWLSGSHEHEERTPRVETAPGERPQTTDRQQRVARFTRAEHIRRRADFQRVYDRGVRVHGRYCTLLLLPTGAPPARLGIAATRKLGGAVARNRAKRLIREVFRRNKIASGFDVVVVPKRELLDASLTALEVEYRRLVERRVRPR